eukprot:TRINITY_DN117260_c0_g1_i1.p1 TRINITY_DN117260_c0_g1~~TRINITY_DN117260_c0_g1_i1.p1  ORF type:complete len:573 (-),score=64.61 TRINITY_DN117260_c0_g1_i1:208-1926(-)
MSNGDSAGNSWITVEDLKQLIKDEGIAVTDQKRDKDGNTLLMLAAKHGELDAVQCLVEEGADIYRENLANYQLWDGELFAGTALLLAASEGHHLIVEYLMQAGSATDRPLSEHTALLLASMKGHCDVVRLLIQQYGLAPTECDPNGRTPLLLASRGGHMNLVQWLLEEGGSKLDERDIDGNTVLLMAATVGNLRLVEWLVKDKQMDISTTATDWLQETALLRAASNGHLPVVQWLHEECNAPLTETDNAGNTALLGAVFKGALPLVQWLVDGKGMDPSGFNASGDNALSIAAAYGHVAVFSWLVMEKHMLVGMQAVMNAVAEGWTNILEWVFSNYLSIVKKNIETFADDKICETAEKTTPETSSCNEATSSSAVFLVDNDEQPESDDWADFDFSLQICRREGDLGHAGESQKPTSPVLGLISMEHGQCFNEGETSPLFEGKWEHHQGKHLHNIPVAEVVDVVFNTNFGVNTDLQEWLLHKGWICVSTLNGDDMPRLDDFPRLHHLAQPWIPRVHHGYPKIFREGVALMIWLWCWKNQQRLPFELVGTVMMFQPSGWFLPAVYDVVEEHLIGW